MQQLTVYSSETDHYERKLLFLKILELATQHNSAASLVDALVAAYTGVGPALHMGQRASENCMGGL